MELDIFQAARAGDCALLGRLLRDGADLNACDRWDSIPLYYACLAGHDDAVRMLLEAGAVYDDSTFEGERCYRAALNLGIRRILCHYESRPRPLRPLPLAPFHAALRSAFFACPTNRRTPSALTPRRRRRRVLPASCGLWPSPPDITLYVQGRPIEAHRVILAARSPYFRRKLATEWRNRKEVTFSSSQSLSFKLMHILVVFFYSDRCEVAAEDLEDFARICKACKCTGMVKRLTAHKKRRDTLTRELGRDYSQKPFVLQGRSMDHRAADSLPSALRRILHDSLANSREEDLRNSELAETCRSSAYDDLADVCIKVGDRVFRCHQLILTLRSEYFKTRLSRRTDFLHSNRGGELPLLEEHDVSAEAFEKMLEYVYTDELEDLDDDDPLSMAEELFDIASRYLLFPLKRVVADLLLPHLDLDLVSPGEICRWLVLSDMYDVAKVREHCQDIIDRNFEAFAESQGSSGPCF
jgi:ankyrin repeat/BTB/POZ domain-containing protein 1